MVHTLQTLLKRASRTLAVTAAFAAASLSSMPLASAASSWNPTLLVNTESFQTIDAGDGGTDVELRFGASTKTIKFLFTKQIFQFSHSISVLGILSGSALNVDRNATVGGTLTVTGAIVGINSITAKTILSGATLRISAGGADIHGPVAVSGAIRTDGNLTINDDGTAADVVLTFGHTANQTITYLNTRLVFQFSKGISVLGTISGSALNVDHNATVGGSLTVTGAILGISSITAKTTLSGNTLVISNSAKVGGTLSASGTVALEGHLTGATIAGFGLKSCNSAGQTLQWNSSNNRFECGTASISNGSGDIIALQAQYPNAILFGSGSATQNVGQLSASGNIVSGVPENFYHWATTRATLQHYWISVRLRLPDNFSSWDASRPIQFRYRTSDGTSTNNHLTLRMRDTSNTLVSLTGAGDLVSADAFTTSDIKGPEAAGTWTPKGYYTVFIKVSALTGKYADAGLLTLRYETTAP